MYTLTNFITNELEKYNLPVTKKNLAKLRSKYTRELKTLNLWETAETKLVDKSQTKIFKEKDLTKIAQKFKPYMEKQIIKQSPYDKKDIQNLKKELQQKIEDQDSYTIQNIDKIIANYTKSQPLQATIKQKKEALHELMLEAIFNHFFIMKPEQKKQFEQDLSESNLDPELHMKDPNYLISMKRLQNKHKIGTYYNLKSETTKKQD